MFTFFHNKLILFPLLAGICTIMACIPSEPSDVQTAMAPAVSTAVAEAERAAKTQGVAWGQTVAAASGTELSSLQQTAIAEASTRMAALLTPQPPDIEHEIRQRDILLYNVVKEIKVSEVAFKFRVPAEEIIRLNQGKYSSITTGESVLEPDWRLVLHIGSPERSELIPEGNDAWEDVPGCIEDQPLMISEVTCNEYTLEFAKERGASLACVTLDDNAWGFYLVRSTYKGQMLYYAGEPFVYGLYYDEEKKAVVIGPAIVKEKRNAIECGVPR